MHRISNILLLVAVLLIGISSCKAPVDSKESYLKNYETFVNDIQKNKDDYSEKEWQEKDEEFKVFSDELYQKYNSELGIFEQIKIAKYAVTYGSIRGVNALNKVLEDEEIEKSIEDLKRLWDDDLKDDLESAIKDIKKVWDEDLKDELEGKLGELKTILEDEEFQSELTKKVTEIKDIINDKELKGELNDVMKEVEKVLKTIEEKAAQ